MLPVEKAVAEAGKAQVVRESVLLASAIGPAVPTVERNEAEEAVAANSFANAVISKAAVKEDDGTIKVKFENGVRVEGGGLVYTGDVKRVTKREKRKIKKRRRGRKAEEVGSPIESGKAQVVRESVPLADKAVAEVGRRQPGAAESSGIEELTADPGNTGIGSQQTVCPLPTKEYHSPGTGSVDEVRPLLSIFVPQNAQLDLSRNTFKKHAKRTIFHLALNTPR